jgi:glutathione S-transferase
MKTIIHAFPPSPRAFKVLWTANHLGLDYELKLVNLGQGAQKQPGFLALNPNGRMPVLEEDGFVLWESNAIVQYLASKKPDSGLLPTDERARADATRWQFWESTSWDPACAILIFERVVKGFFGRGGPDAAEVEKGLQRFNDAARVLNGQLENKRYVCGERLTVADFSLGCALLLSEPAHFPLEDYRGIQRWSTELQALPSWQHTASAAMSSMPAR